MISVHFHSLWLSTDHGIILPALSLVCLLTNKVKLTPYGIFSSVTLLRFLKNLYCRWCALFSGKTLYDSGQCRGLLYKERNHTSQECCTKEEQVSWLLTRKPFFTKCRICWSHSWKGHTSLTFASRLVRKPVFMRRHIQNQVSGSLYFYFQNFGQTFFMFEV